MIWAIGAALIVLGTLVIIFAMVLILGWHVFGPLLHN
jgi:hypothetical protein